MKIALLMGPEEVQVQQQEIPQPGPGQVRIRVKAAGVCGTDIDAYKGHQPKGWTITYPFRMGHELAGVVDAVGEGVTDFAPGDAVVPDGRMPCGRCNACRKGLPNACTNGGYSSGGFMEYSLYTPANLCRIPKGLSFEEAAFTEPVSCCLYGNHKLNVNLGDFAVVIGEGAIGNIHAQLLRARGAEVAVVGLVPQRLAVAKETGAHHVINAKEEDAVAAVEKLTGGKGANIVVCAAGAQAVLAQALAMAGRFGQVLYFAATLKDALTLDLDLVHYKELTLIGSYDSTTAYFEQALQAMAKGLVQVKPLLGKPFSLEEAPAAFEAAKNMVGMKTMILPEG